MPGRLPHTSGQLATGRPSHDAKSRWSRTAAPHTWAAADGLDDHRGRVADDRLDRSRPHEGHDRRASGVSAKAKSKEILDKELWSVDEKVGKVKEMEIDLDDWRITQLEVELEKDVAESVLGAKKGGVRNMLDISALEKGSIRRTDKGLLLQIRKDQLHVYLKPVV